MPERTIISPSYSWFDEEGDIHTHWRGDVVQLSDEEAAKGDALNCFRETRVEYPTEGTPVVDEPVADFTESEPVVPPTGGQGDEPVVSDLTGDALADWFKGKKLADIESAGLTPEQATALLPVEEAKTKPREAVVEALTGIATDPAGEQ